MKPLLIVAALALAAAAHGQKVLVISPATGNFGSIALGKTSPAISFTVTNDTPSTMGYLGYTNLGEFLLAPGTCHLIHGEPMLNPGQSCVFTAAFKPTKLGPVSGVLSIQTSSGTFDVPMAGIGGTPVSYTESVLYSFCAAANCADGSTPFASLVQDPAGNLYGTTLYGGSDGNFCGSGCGTVFKIDTAGHETVIHSFNAICNQAGCSDGFQPFAGLIQDAAGNLYGTTLSGGTGIAAAGVVFKLDSTGRETVLYNFCSLDNCADGSSPYAGLVQDAAGNLYGTTNLGGVGATPCSGRAGYDCSGGAGNVFKIDTTGHETVLYGFCSVGNCADGSHPYFAGLTRDAAGNLYGTTYVGGVGGGGQCYGGGSGCGGVAFKLDNTSHETVLHNFCSVGYYCDDGDFPQGLIRDAAGNLYGTTGYGGGPAGAGTIFKVDTAGNQTVLYDFCSLAYCADGFRPLAGLIEDPAGNLYGTTYFGGTASSSCPNNSNNCGTVFKLDTAGNETVLCSFCSAANCADGESPQAGLIEDAAGNLYGTTRLGGAYGKGTVFKLTPQFK